MAVYLTIENMYGVKILRKNPITIPRMGDRVAFGAIPASIVNDISIQYRDDGDEYIFVKCVEAS